MDQGTSGRQFMYLLLPLWHHYLFMSFFFIKGKKFSLTFLQRVLQVQYSIPENVKISPECRHLISRIFVGDPAKV